MDTSTKLASLSPEDLKRLYVALASKPGGNEIASRNIPQVQEEISRQCFKAQENNPIDCIDSQLSNRTCWVKPNQDCV